MDDLDRRAGELQLDALVRQLARVDRGGLEARARRDRGREDLVGRALLVVRQVDAGPAVEEAELRPDFPGLRLLGLELGVGDRLRHREARLAEVRHRAEV